MLFKRFVGCIYRSLRELCTTPQCAVLLVRTFSKEDENVNVDVYIR